MTEYYETKINNKKAILLDVPYFIRISDKWGYGFAQQCINESFESKPRMNERTKQCFISPFKYNSKKQNHEISYYLFTSEDKLQNRSRYIQHHDFDKKHFRGQWMKLGFKVAMNEIVHELYSYGISNLFFVDVKKYFLLKQEGYSLKYGNNIFTSITDFLDHNLIERKYLPAILKLFTPYFFDCNHVEIDEKVLMDCINRHDELQKKD